MRARSRARLATGAGASTRRWAFRVREGKISSRPTSRITPSPPQSDWSAWAPTIWSRWIHVDACNGGQLIFSRKHRGRLSGIELADSIALDPHKVFNIPYTLSCFLFRDPKQLDGFRTSSTLIMRDPWALGWLTPNIGSKSWSAFKLYLLLKQPPRNPTSTPSRSCMSAR